VFKSKHVTDHKLLKDVHEEFLKNPSQINRFQNNRPDEPLKASGLPLVSSSFTLKMSGRQSNTVQMLGQSVFNEELDFRSQHCLGVSARCPDEVETCQDVVQHFKIFQYLVRTLQGVTAKTIWTLGQAIQT
jgi:hypothetical protein